MKSLAIIATCVAFLMAQNPARAAVRYVDVNSTNPVPPYASWATAANVIQDAVDTAVNGDEVLVTNGLYETGGRTINDGITNRVAVTNTITLRSVNGPIATIIKGYQDTNNFYRLGPSAVRCVYLTNSAALIGFTITNGGTRAVWEEPPTETTLGGGIYCESSSETVSNCIVVGNVSGYYGGGVYWGTISHTSISNNWAVFGGGGADSSVLRHSLISSNSAFYADYGSGGGVHGSFLTNCILTRNLAAYGGGANDSVLHNCAVYANTSTYQGGGTHTCTLFNCTVTINSAQVGGGMVTGTATNSIVYFNSAPVGANHYESGLDHTATTPLISGTGIFTNAPILTDAWHLTADSPGRAAGAFAFTTGTDLDGEAWLNPPSVGADEFNSGTITGPLNIQITATYTNVTTNFLVNLTGIINGHARASRWDFGDGTISSNTPVVSHHWVTPGNYTVTLTAYNDSFPSEVSNTLNIQVSDTPRYVALDNPNPVWPYASWATAATNIQDAVDAAVVGGLVLVSNGVYETGARTIGGYTSLSNRVVVPFPLTLRSVNGPEVTTIKGYKMSGPATGANAVRCIYLAEGSSLAGFTLTNGATSSFGNYISDIYGGGAYCAAASVTIFNCAIRNNSCADRGGGVAFGSVFNSTLMNNSAPGGGGGTYYTTLSNCVIAANSTSASGGGVNGGTATDCVITNNGAQHGGGAQSATLTRCWVAGNSAFGASFGSHGGGVNTCTVLDSTVSGNAAAFDGGSYGSTLMRCFVTNNIGSLGGGAGHGTFDSCIIRSNTADSYGGVSGGSLNNCFVVGNRATSFYGGGAGNCTISNSTIVGNSAVSYGGGVIYYGTVYNSIVYDNSAASGANYYGPGGAEVQFFYSCTTPLPDTGSNNIAAAPLFQNAAAGNYRLTASSPCVNIGNNLFASGTNDLDGATRIISGNVDLGAYEFDPPAPIPPAAPYANTLAASSIQTNQASLNGFATPNGLPATAWFEWGTNTSYGQSTTPQIVGSGADVIYFRQDISGLDRNRTYLFRLVVSNQLGVVVGAPQIFRTGGNVSAWGNNFYNQTNPPSRLHDAVSLAAGASHGLALKWDGRIVAWGGNGNLATNVPAGLSNVIAIAAGAEHGLALRSNGTLTAWGNNLGGEVAIPANLSNVVSIAANYRKSAVLKADGRAQIWGELIVGGVAAAVAAFSNVVAIAPHADSFAQLLLLHDGTVRMAGYNPYGENQSPAGLSNVVAIAAGAAHWLALRRDGTVVGWGANFNGQTNSPPGLTNVIAIQAGYGHSLALRADGTVVMWGAFYPEVLGVSVSPTNVATISAGSGHNLALVPNHPPTAQSQNLTNAPNTDLVIQFTGSDPDGDLLNFVIQSLPASASLYQFTNGTRGDLITSNLTSVTDPQGRVVFAPIPGGLGNPYDSFTFFTEDGELASAPASVAVSMFATAQVFTRPATGVQTTGAQLNGFVIPLGFATSAWFEWGTNTSYGQATAPTNTGSGIDVIHISNPITGLATGQSIHFRLVASNASQTIYGTDQQFVTSGKVTAWGDNSSGQSATPTNLGAVVSVVGGLSHSLALCADGTVAAWGNNIHGQTNVPPTLAGVVAVAAGGFHNLALLTNGSVVAWGRNNLGQTNVSLVAISVVAIAAGGQHSVALRSDGSLVAWGDNSQGQRNISASLTNIVGIAAGWYHNVALRSDSTVTAWGANTYGQTNVPAGLTNVVWVGAGLYHSLALRNDGSLVAWGLNVSGQTNIPPNATNLIAVAAGGSHNLALQSSGALAGWGYNFFGQSTPPVSQSNVVNFAAGGSHSLALLPNRLPVAFDQVVAGYPNTDLVVTLAGSDSDNDAVSYRISALPTAGAVYQYSGGFRGAQIVTANTSVVDSFARIIFAPAANQSGSPHATFGFAASDSFALSTPATVTVNIVLPIAPTLDSTASTVTTNHAFQLAFTGSTNAAYRVWASTNLLNWELLGQATSPAPGQFLFLDATATNWPHRFYRATAP